MEYQAKSRVIFQAETKAENFLLNWAPGIRGRRDRGAWSGARVQWSRARHAQFRQDDLAAQIGRRRREKLGPADFGTGCQSQAVFLRFHLQTVSTLFWGEPLPQLDLDFWDFLQQFTFSTLGKILRGEGQDLQNWSAHFTRQLHAVGDGWQGRREPDQVSTAHVLVLKLLNKDGGIS